MTTQELLSQHHQVCSELHSLALEENRHLRLNQCAPDTAHDLRKRELLSKLSDTVAVLKTLPSSNDPELKPILEKTRDRTLQIMQLNRENEQLLLRSSLARVETEPPAMSPAMLQTVYGRSK